MKERAEIVMWMGLEWCMIDMSIRICKIVREDDEGGHEGGRNFVPPVIDVGWSSQQTLEKSEKEWLNQGWL